MECPREAEDKDLLESDTLQIWKSIRRKKSMERPKVKLKQFEVGNLVLCEALARRIQESLRQNGQDLT
jgi:hypothetical protein